MTDDTEQRAEVKYIFGMPEPLFTATVVGAIVSGPLSAILGFETISIGPFTMLWSWGMVPMAIILLPPFMKYMRGDYDG